MIMLIAGVLLFSAVHLVPSLAPGLKQSTCGRMGEGGYKGLFSLGVAAAMALMIFGWRGTEPEWVYAPPAALHHAALGLVVLAFVLLVAASRRSRLKRWVRHPQLTGVLIWAMAHLLLNGENRSLVLFGGLGLWALLEMFAINRREGAWIKPEAPGWGSEGLTLLIAGGLVGAIILAHPWIAGMPVH